MNFVWLHGGIEDWRKLDISLFDDIKNEISACFYTANESWK